jgi:hypothetical protein
MRQEAMSAVEVKVAYRVDQRIELCQPGEH